ncbi:T9SS type A sorting domain-containing protein [Tamlana sp. 2201CG12-4]|uniref:T9SS type A sorting domain-containing protein n=1 Tax=Tamlana sp. 2201CG12-4 TaxID=3112582 RepID=UPI002DB8578C|nr:T9SS type A sorting domain-containing protein [Tamlana sp. 2201CG12-4]MEC3906449.1 T9SS type A sorting domain-containing protein [Tamlana sp. 2201CG12-4]
MKKIVVLSAWLLICSLSFGQTTLEEGDLVITGVNARPPNEFSFLLLTDVLSGTEIGFTDKSWHVEGGVILSGSGQPTPEGIVTWTAASDLSCGTEIVITDTGSNTYSASTGSAVETENGFLFRYVPGDQLIAYQGSLFVNPTFLYAVHFANANGWTDAVDGTNGDDSAVPPGLTEGITAIDLGNFDNHEYLCTETSNLELILETAANVNATNWYQTNSNTVADRPVFGTCTYTCSAVGTCASTVTYNGSWIGTPNLSTAVIISSDYSTSLGNFNACSLTIDPGVTLTVENGTYLAIQNEVTVDGTLIVETQGNFVQNRSGGTFTVNPGGLAKVNKETPPKAEWYYYTYWSSPVAGETIGNVFPNIGRRFWFNANNFIDNDGDNIDDDGNDWQRAFFSTSITPGVGYAVTTGQLYVPNAADYATFEGAFNTGNVPVNITFNAANTGNRLNLIGNPYPSAIDFAAFHYANASIIDGVAYFWSQASPPDKANPGNQRYNFNINDYATFTVGTGGTAGGVPTAIPNGFVPSGQGFFVKALSAGTATFTNAMRTPDNSSNNQFFKSANSKQSSTQNSLENRLWVNLTSDNGIFNQILVGYVNNATDNYDGHAFDAPKLISPGFTSILYSSIENQDAKYAIQGKHINSINKNETIKLGYITNVNTPTIYKFSIAQTKGNFLAKNPIYLKDNTLNRIHDLSSSDYTFTSDAGEFNERFEIVFQANTLTVNETDANNTDVVNIKALDDDHIQISTSDHLKIKTVRIFDLSGRQLYKLSGIRSSETYKLPHLHGIYIVKITLSNGDRVTQKVIKK